MKDALLGSVCAHDFLSDPDSAGVVELACFFCFRFCDASRQFEGTIRVELDHADDNKEVLLIACSSKKRSRRKLLQA